MGLMHSLESKEENKGTERTFKNSIPYLDNYYKKEG